jgi:hypothetical protein
MNKMRSKLIKASIKIKIETIKVKYFLLLIIVKLNKEPQIIMPLILATIRLKYTHKLII